MNPLTDHTPKLISIVTPCYNEEEAIGHCLDRIRFLMETELAAYNYEHIICDNCSTDKTVDIVKEYASEDHRIKLVVNSRNFGVFQSMYNGLVRSSGEAIITLMPADLQDPPELIPEFVKLWEQGYEVVAGARVIREEPFLIRKSRSLFYRMLAWMSEFEIPEKVGEFQLIDRKVADSVLTYNDAAPFLRSMIASVGFRRIIVPYTWHDRKVGKSKMSLVILVDHALNALFSFATRPLRYIFYVGLATFIGCMSFMLFFLIYYSLGYVDAVNGIPTLIFALFFFSGIQLISLGVIGEYVFSILRQSRGGPVVFESETVNFESDTLKPLSKQAE